MRRLLSFRFRYGTAGQECLVRVDPSPTLYSAVSLERFQENAVLCSGNYPALPKASLVHSVVVATEAN